MPITLNEPIIKALQDRLEADLLAQVTAINAAVTDGFTIANPYAVLEYVPPPSLLNDFPTVGIEDGPSYFEDDTGFSATGRHEIVIVPYLQSDNQEALSWQLRRYEQAIVRVALDTRKLGTAAWGSRLVRIIPGPTLGAPEEDPREWTSFCAIVVEFKRDEDT